VELNDHLSITGRALRNWAIAQLQDSLAVGVLWLIGLRILGVRFSFVWAALAGLLQIVPHLGPILGMIGPFVTAGIAARNWQHPLGVVILYVVIVTIDGFLLQPYIMRRTAKVPVWASIVAPIVLGILWPFWGVFLAPPLLAVVYAYKAHSAR
jgi:predicted PurR-regulated permease PerM